MTTVQTLSTPAASSSASTSAGLNKETLDYDAFLKLLVAQMQNQDPLNPMDSTEYVAQLASFSNVEQGLKMNTKLDQLLVLSNMAQANNVVGMKVTSADGKISGVVASVTMTEGTASATLTDGRTIAVGAGITVAAP